jgi:hypothetical protein
MTDLNLYTVYLLPNIKTGRWLRLEARDRLDEKLFLNYPDNRQNGCYAIKVKQTSLEGNYQVAPIAR